MINIPNHPVNPAMRPKRNQVEPVVPTPPAQNEKTDITETRPLVERRKSGVDRRQHSADRGPFDSRAGRDRRRNQPGRPSIETDA